MRLYPGELKTGGGLKWDFTVIQDGESKQSIEQISSKVITKQ